MLEATWVLLLYMRQPKQGTWRQFDICFSTELILP